MICRTCDGQRLVAVGMRGDELVMGPCPDCIGGIASCCDAAGSADGYSEAEIERSQRMIGELLDSGYRNDTCPERLCDRCSQLYRGPAVYCSLNCAIADA